MRERPEREQARELYQQGMTYNQIVAHLNVAKSTVSKWCHDLVRQAERKPRPEREPRAPKERPARRPPVGQPAAAPYLGWTVYHYSQGGVNRVQLLHRESGRKRTLSGHRYMMAAHLGREIERDELVVRRDLRKPLEDVNDLIVVRKTGERRQRLRPIKPKACVMCEELFEPRRPEVETCGPECKALLVSAILTRG